LNGKRWLDGIPVERGSQHPVVNGCTQPVGNWWESNSGIEAKARELGMEQGSDQWPVFKAKVKQAAEARGAA